MGSAAPATTIWRDDKFLVMYREAELPDRCLKTNFAANGQRSKAVCYWHHPAVYLLLFNPLLYVFAALSMRKKVIIRCGVSPQALDQHKRRKILFGMSGLVGLCFAFGSVEMDAIPIMLFEGILWFSLVLIVMAWRWQIVRIKKLQGDYIWLHGVAPAFLSELPDWKTKQ